MFGLFNNKEAAALRRRNVENEGLSQHPLILEECCRKTDPPSYCGHKTPLVNSNADKLVHEVREYDKKAAIAEFEIYSDIELKARLETLMTEAKKIDFALDDRGWLAVVEAGRFSSSYFPKYYTGVRAHKSNTEYLDPKDAP